MGGFTVDQQNNKSYCLSMSIHCRSPSHCLQLLYTMLKIGMNESFMFYRLRKCLASTCSYSRAALD